MNRRGIGASARRPRCSRCRVAGASACAQAADPWPNRPLRMVIPFAPGGTTDLIGRMVAEGLSRALGQPVVVENKAGAGGNVGADRGGARRTRRLHADDGHARSAGDQSPREREHARFRRRRISRPSRMSPTCRTSCSPIPRPASSRWPTCSRRREHGRVS